MDFLLYFRAQSQSNWSLIGRYETEAIATSNGHELLSGVENGSARVIPFKIGATPPITI